MADEKVVFVTVGTTSFDELIKAVFTKEVLEALKNKGFSKVVCQIGRGDAVPDATSFPHVTVEFYRFKKSIKEDIQAASLVISHSGAGSILETLGCEKPLIAVINDQLHDNHQRELAKKMSNLKFLHCCTCRTLLDTLHIPDGSLHPYQAGDPQKFAISLNKMMGFESQLIDKK